MSFNNFCLCRVQQQIPLLPLKAAEERWASSALFSCAVQLHSNNLPQSAETLFAAACHAAASSLCKVMHDGSQAAQVTMTMLHAPQAATECLSSNHYACFLPEPLHMANTLPHQCICGRFALLSWSHLHLLASAACKTACNRSRAQPNKCDFPAARDAGTDAKLCQKEPSPGQCPAPAGPHTSSPDRAGQCPNITSKLGNGFSQMWAASGAGIGHSQSRLAEWPSSEGSKQARQQVSLFDALGHHE